MKFEFPALPYAYDALEPHIDRMTMEIHHTKHHRAYFDKFIAAIQGTELENMSLEEIFSSISKAPAAVRNNGGGFYNHNLFWEILSPKGGGLPGGKLAESINKDFGSFEAFKTKFNDAAANRFGSGWAWLSLKADKSLCVCSSPNQDNPLMDVHDCPGQPIMGLDVWEHAYYLKYQNRRPDYINAFWSLVNWDKVSENYEKAL
ncbi:Superoxide dismutase [Mn] [bioreactor metagenome]|jgi:Fe-Mn family superoxide dismutase|uniref:superoxide dismutase n=1 Tax=bioreactor metagenome TaxID=1076179 RepID=A0A644TRX2_9ZZZZ|nr:superoxide dismutase [Lentimicrobium sp.]MEA5110525.1 superoxide dismutase [Lentimicrobium sp.]HCT70670.1 superoxide dismutase [Bacteroidales bacterium]